MPLLHVIFHVVGVFYLFDEPANRTPIEFSNRTLIGMLLITFSLIVGFMWSAIVVLLVVLSNLCLKLSRVHS